jgi:release factor glutamine methyltransferase
VIDLVATLRAAGCVFAEDEARLLVEAAPAEGELAALVARRVAGEPLEYVLGWVEFCGLRIAVEAGVFVPRRRTEFLVEQAAAVLAGPIVVELCCGCGAVGAALATRATVEMHAADIDPAAVRCARRNLESSGGHVYEGDLFAPLPSDLRGRVGVVVANVPYVPTEAIASMPPEARLYEPRIALDGGPDGLDVARRLAAEAPSWLAPGGHLLIETSQLQAPRAVEVFRARGLQARAVRSEEHESTVVIGQRTR